MARKRITEIWVWVLVEADGVECAPTRAPVPPGSFAPFLAADTEARACSLEAFAQACATARGLRLKLMRFRDGEVVAAAYPPGRVHSDAAKVA